MCAQCIVLQQPVKLAVIFKTDNNDVGESYAIYTCWKFKSSQTIVCVILFPCVNSPP